MEAFVPVGELRIAEFYPDCIICSVPYIFSVTGFLLWERVPQQKLWTHRILRLIVQPCDEDEEKHDKIVSFFPSNRAKME
jgi:hypothetical protein